MFYFIYHSILFFYFHFYLLAATQSTPAGADLGPSTPLIPELEVAALLSESRERMFFPGADLKNK